MENLVANQKREKIILGITVAALVLVLAISLFTYSQKKYRKVDPIEVPVVVTPKQIPFEKVSLSARSAVVWDVQKQEFIYKKNETQILPLASLTKLMTALAAAELVPENSTIRISGESLQEEGRAEVHLGESWEPKKLVALTLMSSSNAAARAVGTAAGAFLPTQYGKSAEPRDLFIDYMNSRAQELGLKSVLFYNDNGLDLDVDSENSGAYGNAEDVAKLVDYIIQKHPEILEPTKHSRMSIVSKNNIVHDIKNTNIIVENIPGVIGSKTGFTDLAQGNLTVAFSPGLSGPFVAVVLGSTYDDRFNDINRLISATINHISQ